MYGTKGLDVWNRERTLAPAYTPLESLEKVELPGWSYRYYQTQIIGCRKHPTSGSESIIYADFDVHL